MNEPKPPPESESRGARLFAGGIAALLLTAVALRILLIAGGGQFFTPDESRYNESRAAADLILQGKIREGLAKPFATGDHPGFKFIGLAPALLESKLGRNDRLPAFFFSQFSVLSLIFIWLCARRLGATREAQFWALLFAVCSGSLFFYARHLYPYDVSMCLGWWALYIGLKEDGGWGRSVAVGALAGAAFLTYLGYWSLAGVMIALHVLRRGGGWRDLGRRAGATIAGAAGVLGGAWLMDKLGAGQMIENARRFSATVSQGDFGEGYWLPWEYLFRAEGVLLGIFVWAFLSALRWMKTDAHQRSWTSPIFCGVAGVVLVYGALVLASNGLHKFVVYGRVARLLVPFFCLLSGGAVAHALSGWRWKRWVRTGLAVILAASAGMRFGVVLRQEFPRDFRRKGEQLLPQRPAAPANSYYRFVNVDHYLFEPEVLKDKPAETLLVARHPYQFLPYLYEGFSPSERVLRRQIDHRMRLVRMVAPPNRQIHGEPYGMVTMRLRFPGRREGFVEPLLSIGPVGHGNLFFARYEAGNWVKFGFESMGVHVVWGERHKFEPGRINELELFCGALTPAAMEEKASDATGPRPEFYRRMVCVRWNGREIINSYTPYIKAAPEEIFAGVNRVEAGSAENQFSGEIIRVRRGGMPPAPGGENNNAEFGAVEINFLPAASGAKISEPLVVVGEEGRGILGFVRSLPDNKFQFGVEIWGVGAWESKPIALKPGAVCKVNYSFGSLFPPLGHPDWHDVPPERQAYLKKTLRIEVNGGKALEIERATPEFATPAVYYGLNPIGGSYVTDKYSGQILAVARVRPSVPRATPALR